MENKDKLLSIKEGLEIIQKYDQNGNFRFVDKLLNSEDETFDNPIPKELFDEVVHSNVASYTNLDSKKLIK